MAAILPSLPDVKQLSPLVTRILGGNPSKVPPLPTVALLLFTNMPQFTLQGTNTYLIGRGPSRILIDTGQGLPHWSHTLSTHLTAHNLTISTVLLTHHHADHTLGIPSLLALCPTAAIHKHPAAPSPHGHHAALPSTPPLLPLADEQVFATEGATLRALHTPGHTADHVCFLLAEEGALFTGDNVLGHGTAVFEDLSLYMASLERMRAHGGWTGCAYPGHGEVVERGTARVAEYVAHRRIREEEVLGVLREEGSREGRTPGEVVRVVYKDVPVSLHEAAEGGVVQVLGKLEGEGRVVRGEGGRWKLARKEAL
ncbi:hypothetical protein MMC26_007030 [Xylographa opegraphella]|nr:hypothetical protein [Xylographa opegraphella]